MKTEILDKLYLEWSQFTSARTERERVQKMAIKRALKYLSDATPKTRNGPCIQAVAVLKAVSDA